MTCSAISVLSRRTSTALSPSCQRKLIGSVMSGAHWIPARLTYGREWGLNPTLTPGRQQRRWPHAYISVGQPPGKLHGSGGSHDDSTMVACCGHAAESVLRGCTACSSTPLTCQIVDQRNEYRVQNGLEVTTELLDSIKNLIL